MPTQVPKVFTRKQGSSPLLVSIPHNGSFIPDEIASKMTATGKSSKDTDWFLNRLYDVPPIEDVNLLVANCSRYVIDLNRAKTDESLYPGQTTTGLIPLTSFDGEAIYKTQVPGEEAIASRVENFWQPYHDAIRNELDRIQEQHGFAILLEAHSIASQVPRLFEGTLPDFNFGNNRGQSCNDHLLDQLVACVDRHESYTSVSNGRFVGGYITRNYGNPPEDIHAIQIELSQATYMDETTLQWDDVKATKVQLVFADIIQTAKSWTPIYE